MRARAPRRPAPAPRAPAPAPRAPAAELEALTSFGVMGGVALALALAFAGAWGAARTTAGDHRAAANVPVRGRESDDARRERATLRVVTANLAHGRGQSTSQLLLSEARIRANVERAATALAALAPDVVALQEADGPSLWSGDFDHVALFAGRAGLPLHLRGAHVDGLGLSYGTAIVAALELREPRAVTFRPSPPTFSKGFSASTVTWPTPAGPRYVDVYSVHLDFARASVRRRQLRRLARELADRDRPAVVLGDFNCAWDDSRSAVRALCDRLELRAYMPESDALATFPATGRRLDWILISRELSFVSYEVIADAGISDHAPVLAEIALRPPRERRGKSGS